MPSNAKNTFAANKDDLDRLWELHSNEVGDTPGRKYNIDVLNRAAVVMVCAAWEAYCEDIVEEAIGHIAADCADPARLPKSLKKHIAKQLKNENDELALWKVAGNGWQAVVATNATNAVKRLTGAWNTPKTSQVNDLFKSSLGIDDISSKWHWQKNPVSTVTDKLDEFVTLRGEIAHRLKTVKSVRKSDGNDFYEFVARLAEIIDREVHSVLVDTTGKTYW